MAYIKLKLELHDANSTTGLDEIIEVREKDYQIASFFCRKSVKLIFSHVWIRLMKPLREVPSV